MFGRNTYASGNVLAERIHNDSELLSQQIASRVPVFMLADFYCSLFGKIDNGVKLREILTVLPQGEILRFDRRFIHIGDSLRVVFLAH